MAKQINLTATQINDRLAAVPNKADTSSVNASLALKADKTELTSGLAGKQATLVSGTNIKTINNQSILGSGNITIQGGGGGGASDYSQLTNKPQIGGVELSGNKSLADLGVAASSHTHNAGEVTYSDSTTYADGSAGKAITDLAQKVNGEGASANQVLTKNADGTTGWKDQQGGGGGVLPIVSGNVIEFTEGAYVETSGDDHILVV